MFYDAPPALEKEPTGKPYQYVLPRTKPSHDLQVGALFMQVPSIPHCQFVVAQTPPTSTVPENSLRVLGRCSDSLVIDSNTNLASSSTYDDSQVVNDLYAIRNLTDLTWERLAELTGNSRQAVYKWLVGGKISQKNRGKLAEIRALIESIDSGVVSRNADLLGRSVHGRTVFQQIKDGNYALVRNALTVPLARNKASKVGPESRLVSLSEQLSAPGMDSDISVIGPRSKAVRTVVIRTK